jgi:hypothetical protein
VAERKRNVENENREYTPIQEGEMEELQQQIRDAKEVVIMLDSPGWKNVMKPGIDRALNEQLIAFRQAQTYQEFIYSQQTIKALEEILNCAKRAIALGESARERINEENKHQPDDNTQD